MTVAGVVQPDDTLGACTSMRSSSPPSRFRSAAGWLAGAVIQEFQHTSFATVLPGVRPRIAAGFLAAGLAVTAIVGCGIALLSSTPQNLPVLFVVGLGAYCLGGVLLDPLSGWITSLNAILVLFVIVRSRDVARRQRLFDLVLEGQVRSVYEPIVDVSTHTVFGYEALARGPAGGKFASPAMLFGVAGRENLLFELDCLCGARARSMVPDRLPRVNPSYS